MQVFVKRYSSKEREAHAPKLPPAKFIATSQRGDVWRWKRACSSERHRGYGDKFCTSRLWRENPPPLPLPLPRFGFSGSAPGWKFILDISDSTEHLLLTSCPTLRAEEEEEEEDAEEAWWRGLCRWGMWSRLGWEEADPVWPCCWTTQANQISPAWWHSAPITRVNTITIISNNHVGPVIARLHYI